ncbi:MAG: transposase [Proteobacteria bacterium]|nr:transposase [Pseudomonadota bacterium]
MRDRLSWRRFVGLGLQDAVPDETVLVRFRQRRLRDNGEAGTGHRPCRDRLRVANPSLPVLRGCARQRRAGVAVELRALESFQAGGYRITAAKVEKVRRREHLARPFRLDAGLHLGIH